MPSTEFRCFRFTSATACALFMCGVSTAQDFPDQEPDTSAAQAAIQRARAAAGVQTEQTYEGQPSLSSATRSGSTQLPDYQPFMRAVSGVWKALRTGSEFRGPIDKILDAADASVTAYSGTVPTTYPEIDKLRDFSHELRDRLWDLKQKSLDAWIYDSGVNELRPASFSAGEAYLDDWSHQLESVKIDVERVIPQVRAGERIVLAESVREVAGGSSTTTELLNPGVLGDDILPDLEASRSFIEDIQRRLEEAREHVAANGRNLRDAIERFGKKGSGASNDGSGAPASLQPSVPASRAPVTPASVQMPANQQPAAPAQASCAPGDHSTCGCEPPGATSCR